MTRILGWLRPGRTFHFALVAVVLVVPITAAFGVGWRSLAAWASYGAGLVLHRRSALALDAGDGTSLNMAQRQRTTRRALGLASVSGLLIVSSGALMLWHITAQAG
ncbi:MAG: hypothetical protein ACK5H2_05710 [Beutenbergiaceae bacterium]